MNASEAREVTAAADLRKLFLDDVNQTMAGIKKRILGRAQRGFGFDTGHWIERHAEGLYGKAIEETITRRLRDEGYTLSQAPCGAQSYTIRWGEDKRGDRYPGIAKIARGLQRLSSTINRAVRS